MFKRIGSVGLSMIFTLAAAGQTTVTTTSGGTANAIPMFTGSTNIENSAITDASGSIGIGTTAPGALLNVGSLNNSTQAYGSNPALFISNPTQHTVPTAEIKFSPATPGCAGCWNIAGKITVSDNAGSSKTNYGLWIDSNSAATNYAIYANSGNDYFAGNVGIGTNTPGASLEVNGNVKLTSGSGANLTFPDSTVQSTAWTGTLTGGDYAESVDITGDRAKYEPGDVLVIDRSHPGHFLKSVDRYSKRVAGVYSTKPGMVGRRQTTDKALCTTEVPMAIVGIVPTKVSAENGPIESGDLLVASSKAGYAMKGTDPALMMGAVIGKAMDSLDSGTGVIEVLISLQ